jgi:gamma-carbonic anhydrase
LILPHHGKWPVIHETAFVAPSADVIGDVEVGSHSSIWFQVVIRGDVHRIRIGTRTNIQDHSMLHVTRDQSPLTIGDEVTIGHRATLHGCTVGNRVLVGMGAIILDDAVIGDDCVIGAGALVTKGTQVPPGSLVIGAPGKVARPLRPEELKFLPQSAENYVRDAMEYYGYVRGPERLGARDQDLEVADLEAADMGDADIASGERDEEYR